MYSIGIGETCELFGTHRHAADINETFECARQRCGRGVPRVSWTAHSRSLLQQRLPSRDKGLGEEPRVKTNVCHPDRELGRYQCQFGEGYDEASGIRASFSS